MSTLTGQSCLQALHCWQRSSASLTCWSRQPPSNPGKLIDAYPLDSNLRLGAEYRTMPVEIRFKYPDDRGSFAHAVERCFGVGKCRSPDGQTMCSSFQATREEMH